mmetsp:Transcript_39073/g.74898  ORF Transcript_39073/g.74898 Transcript_39073/m.74898 type:complete len:201 (-) Transcript_39073:263-865(-)
MVPMACVFASIEAVNASTSFFFAAIIPSYVAMALFSESVDSASALLIVSSIVFKMPTISPLCGAYPTPCEPDRKATSCCLSTSNMSWLFRANCLMAFAAGVCKKPPTIPFSRAATALSNAAMLVSNSSFSAAKALASFSRIAVALAIASFAAARSTIACFKSAFVWASFSFVASSCEVTAGTLFSAAEMLADKSLLPVLQ